MAKYSIELRDVIESLNVDLFDFDYEYYADNYALQRRFENMFIQHYYFHEIGFETIERFKLNLQARLNLNAPLYKQYWESHLRTKDIDFAVNKDYTETVTRELETESATSSSSNNNSVNNNESTSISNADNKLSNIGDGVSMAKLSDEYVTGIENEQRSVKTNDTQTTQSNDTSNVNDTGKQTETLTTSGKGNIGTTSSAQLIKEWRQIMLNLDRQIIEDCADLFMQIY